MADSGEVFEIARTVDAERVATARRDQTAALILQNARTSKRFDPAGKVRTPAFERALQIVGLVLCGGGFALTLLILVVEWLLSGEVNGKALVFGAVFLALFLVFIFSTRLRRRMTERVDRGFVRKVAKRMKEIEHRIPATVVYRIDWPQCEAVWLRDDEVIAGWKRDLAKVRYGLIGDASIVLFRGQKSIVAQAILFASFEDQAKIASFLQEKGVELERIGEHLLPESTVKRDLFP